MQNSGLGQDTVVPIPGYSAAAGITRFGPDQVAPFHMTTEPLASEARQKVADGHEIESSCPLPSTDSWPDHGPPRRPRRDPGPVHDEAQRRGGTGDGRRLGARPSEVVHGAGCWVQEEPFQSEHRGADHRGARGTGGTGDPDSALLVEGGGRGGCAQDPERLRRTPGPAFEGEGLAGVVDHGAEGRRRAGHRGRP